MTFSLLETMRLDAGRVVRVDRHLARAARSAAYFAYPWDERAARAAIAAQAAARPEGTWRMRLLVSADGAVRVECARHEPGEPRRWRLALAAEPVDETDPFLANKTTRRDVYDRARASRPDVDDVILWNRRGEVTETTIGNVVAEIDGVRFTPPVSAGLLPGVFRGEVLGQGLVQERTLTRDDLRAATQLWLINSLREWVPAELV